MDMDFIQQLSRLELLSALFLTVVAISLSTRFLSGLSSGAASSSRERKPSVLPYWLPWLGHTFELTLTPQSFLKAARDSTLNTIFGVKSFGSTSYVVHLAAQREQVRKAYARDDVGFPSQGIATACGVSNYAKLERDGIIGDVGSAFQKHFSQPSASADLTTRMVRSLQAMLPQLVSFLDTLVDQSIWERELVKVIKTADGEEAVIVDLPALVPNFLGNAITPTLTGTALVEIFPALFTNFGTFKFAFALMSYGLPRWLPIPRVTSAHIARKHILDKLQAFHSALQKNISGSGTAGEWGEMTDVSPALLDCYQIYEKHSLPLRTRAALDLCNLSSIDLGINDICTPALSRIVSTPGLADQIRAETAKFASATQPEVTLGIAEPPRLKLNVEGLVEKCPLLRSCIVETIRLDTFPRSTGRLTDSVKASDPAGGSFVLDKGDRVLLVPGLDFMDSGSFPSPNKWDPNRHLTLSEAGLDIIQSYESSKNFPRRDDEKQPSFMLQQCAAFIAGTLALWDIESLKKGNLFMIKRRSLKPQSKE